MGRPRKISKVAFVSKVQDFKPRGVPLRNLEIAQLTVEEREALRLADLVGKSHEEAGKMMGVSRATFGRILQRARQSVADALVNGKAIRIHGGSYKVVQNMRAFSCRHCGVSWEEPFGRGRPECCPDCAGERVRRIG